MGIIEAINFPRIASLTFIADGDRWYLLTLYSRPSYELTTFTRSTDVVLRLSPMDNPIAALSGVHAAQCYMSSIDAIRIMALSHSVDDTNSAMDDQCTAFAAKTNSRIQYHSQASQYRSGPRPARLFML